MAKKASSKPTILELQIAGTAKLTNIVWHPELEVDLLISAALKKDKAFLYAHPEHKPTSTQVLKFKDLLRRRVRKEPFAYLTGEKEFMGLSFLVDSRVLIPRSDTEVLAEEATKAISQGSFKTFFDIGTGSGAVAVSVAKNTRKKIDFYATDVSGPALTVARKNYKRLLPHTKIAFLKGNLLEPVFKKNISHPLLVVSNPPYLTSKESVSTELKFEPQIALSGGKEGLDLVEKLMSQFAQICKPGDQMIFEMGALQGKKVKALAKKIFPKAKVEIIKDYAKLDRVTKISI